MLKNKNEGLISHIEHMVQEAHTFIVILLFQSKLSTWILYIKNT